MCLHHHGYGEKRQLTLMSLLKEISRSIGAEQDSKKQGYVVSA